MERRVADFAQHVAQELQLFGGGFEALAGGDQNRAQEPVAVVDPVLSAG